jgi:Zn-dependent oligopeptidase
MTQVNVLLNYSNLTEEILENAMNDYVKHHNQVVDTILNIEDDELSWNNLVKPFIDLDNAYINNAYLDMNDFYPDEKIRDKATAISTEFSKWAIEQNMRKDIYSKYKSYSENKYLEEKSSLSQEQISYFDNMMTSYKIKGMDLSDEKFERYKQIQKVISELCSNFRQNLGNENYSELLDPEQLVGLPEKYIKERTNSDGKVKVTLKYPDYIPLMEYCQNRQLRMKFSKLFKSRCIIENTPLIEQVFKLRSEIADVFGFENYSDYKLQKSMANDTQTVTSFLNDLLVRVKPLLHSDIDSLTKLANADGIDKLEMYDIAYYSRIFTESTCNFDKEQLKQYFPVEKVLSGAFKIYQTLLGYTFEKVTGMENTFWHDSVELYQVVNSSTGNLVGYFYLDLYPREGKYGHAACFPFITKSDVTYPVATMACNFGKGNLTFEEVETFFHEFGHVMHHLSSKSTIKSTASFSCEHDFVETPSQMFEEWCYCDEPLKMMSEGLPDEMITKLNQSRKLLQGYHYARQLMFGLFDMTIHSSQYNKLGLNPAELFAQVQKDVLEMDVLEGTSEPASFGHLMGGYDSGYYGYAWSLVYAKDLFGKFREEGMLNSELGIKLRDQVLAQGSIRKSLESIKIFLEREPSNQEFINSIC